MSTNEQPTPPAIHRITPDNPPQFPCWLWSGIVGLWWHADGPWQKNYTASDYDAEGQTHWCQSPKRPTVTPDAPTVPTAPTKPADWPEWVQFGPKDWPDTGDNGCYRHACRSCGAVFHGNKRRPPECRECAPDAPTQPAAAPTPTLPDENLEAACLLEKAAKSLCWGRPVTIKEDIHSDLHRALTLGIRALTEQMPRPAAVTADAEVSEMSNVAAQALARAEAAEREAAEVRKAWNEREPQLLAAERERDELRAEVLRLQGNASMNADQLATAERVLDAYRVQLAEAKQEARRD